MPWASNLQIICPVCHGQVLLEGSRSDRPCKWASVSEDQRSSADFDHSKDPSEPDLFGAFDFGGETHQGYEPIVPRELWEQSRLF